MKIQAFFEPRTSSLSYVAYDEVERTGVVVDSVLDFDLASGRTWTESAEAIARFLEVGASLRPLRPRHPRAC